jgi:hypothetical protein
MMIEIIGWLMAIYMVVAFVMAIVALATSYKILRNMNWLEQILFFALQPVLIIREGLK